MKNQPISIEDLPQDKIKELIKRLSQIRKKKYERCKDKRYGNLNKGFTEGELQQFFKCCKNSRAFLAFKIMALLGLRITECVNIKILDLDFQKNKIRIDTEKAGTIDYLYLHNEVRKLLFEWCEKFQEEILAHDGFVLFPDPKGSSGNKHISANWLRKEFRKVCLLANLNESYGMANNYIGNGKFKDRKLFRLTSHSLRHYYISKIYRSCSDPLKTQKLAKKMAEDITEQGFPEVWSESKEDLKLMSRKEACEEMFFAGAVEAFFTFMKESMGAWKELPDSEDELWEDGGFIKKINPDDMQTKMRTFSMGHNEEMNFECKNCKVKISAHNNDWHEGLCDKCFDIKFNDGEVHIEGS